MDYRRLTTEESTGNMGYMLNATKVICKEVYLRDFNDEGDLSLVDYCKKEHKKLYDSDIEATAEDFGDLMDDDSLLSIFYWMSVGHAELRLRLSAYEDSGLSPEQVKGLQDENASLRNWNVCEEEEHIKLIKSDKRRIKLEERLQISPYGDDKIDELEQALDFCKFENEQLKKQNTKGEF